MFNAKQVSLLQSGERITMIKLQVAGLFCLAILLLAWEQRSFIYSLLLLN